MTLVPMILVAAATGVSPAGRERVDLQVDYRGPDASGSFIAHVAQGDDVDGGRAYPTRPLLDAKTWKHLGLDSLRFARGPWIVGRIDDPTHVWLAFEGVALSTGRYSDLGQTILVSTFPRHFSDGGYSFALRVIPEPGSFDAPDTSVIHNAGRMDFDSDPLSRLLSDSDLVVLGTVVHMRTTAGRAADLIRTELGLRIKERLKGQVLHEDTLRVIGDGAMLSDTTWLPLGLAGRGTPLRIGGEVVLFLRSRSDATPASWYLPVDGYALVYQSRAYGWFGWAEPLPDLRSRIQTLLALPQEPYGGMVVGTVAEKGTGKMVPGARVALNRKGIAAITDDGGRFRFFPVPIGPEVLSVTAPCCAPVSSSIVVTDEWIDSLRVLLPSGPDR